MNYLVKATVAILLQEPVLENISTAQNICQYDIEGIYRLFCHLTGAPMSSNWEQLGAQQEEEEVTRRAHRAGVQKLLGMSREESVSVIRDYLISSTAKDCSIMIAMQHIEDEKAPPLHARHGRQGVDPQDCGMITISCSNPNPLVIRYRVTVVDLDRKPLSKIRKHYELDKKIVEAARRQTAQGRDSSG